MSDEPRFYVYLLMDGLVPIYVGKGQGARCRTSQKKHGGVIEIVRRFDDEYDALDFEKELIAKYKPECNKTAGGEGISRDLLFRSTPEEIAAQNAALNEKAKRQLMKPRHAAFWIRCLSAESRRSLMDKYPKAQALFKHYAPELALEC